MGVFAQRTHEIIPMRNCMIQNYYSEQVANFVFGFIKEHGIETSRTAFQETMLDEDDRVFYEVSLSVEDSFLVTGNFKHYPQTPKVISPADFLKVMMDSKEE